MLEDIKKRLIVCDSNKTMQRIYRDGADMNVFAIFSQTECSGGAEPSFSSGGYTLRIFSQVEK